MNILHIHINSRMVQMPIFGAILALRDKEKAITFAAINQSDP